jgi:hypothetical protein
MTKDSKLVKVIRELLPDAFGLLFISNSELLKLKAKVSK